MNGLSADDWVRVIAVLMALTLVIGTGFLRSGRIQRMPLSHVAWMALAWAAIIAAAAMAFSHFRPNG